MVWYRRVQRLPVQGQNNLAGTGAQGQGAPAGDTGGAGSHEDGIGLDEQIREDTELEDALKMFNAYDTEPEKILLAVAFDATDGSREGYWSTEWNGPTGASKFVHRKNDDLDSTYELLTALGYEMADDEKALQDGTHQLFAVYGSGSKADTPCDKCKAAHPECDKCCKTCDDHCNAFQLCRKEYGE